MSKISNNAVWHNATVTRERREQLNGHKSAILWFTGLSGSGKSTLAHSIEERLHQMGCKTFVFDGDNVRHGLCGDLGFSDNDRKENLRRIGEMVKLFLEAGTISLTAFISPFKEDLARIRAMVPADDFVEIYCRCPISVCEARDVKGLYKKARAGEIPHFTGISSPYEEPENADLVVDTDGSVGLDETVAKILAVLRERDILKIEPGE
ncbi:adenylyl-sulfate kinase [Sulfuriflexus sp.]|uniref:adenylyl-sulfate kinase n=1 Tax=Sulfuriflexus sp. TaxID=2015443 RepID=UPI0028CD1758|nr:adenylyl-sulfate kinase [Sulfuriflexus sp.]MDT8405254.1 adenylyl-sulfate kinase [Sulfuriflexus sp.]